MLQHKLIDFLKSFDRKEMTRFKEFSLSPYFNKHVWQSKVIVWKNELKKPKHLKRIKIRFA